MTGPPAETRSECGAALSLAREIIVSCDRGDHQNCGFHEGDLGREWVQWRVRWSLINGGGPTEAQLVRKAGA